MVLEERRERNREVSSLRDAGYAVSNDIVSGSDADNLEADVVAKEECAVYAAERTTTQGALATLVGPGLAGGVVRLEA